MNGVNWHLIPTLGRRRVGETFTAQFCASATPPASPLAVAPHFAERGNMVGGEGGKETEKNVPLLGRHAVYE